MANSVSSLIDSAVRATAPVVDGVTDAQLTDPTPCAEFDVRALLNHLFHVVTNFQKLAVREPADLATAAEYLDEGDWRSRFREEGARLAKAWAAPGAEEGISPAMGLPQRSLAAMVLGDLLVHGWDLARATGQEYTPDAATVEEVAPELEKIAPMGRNAGVFGEAVPAPAGATRFERLLGDTGRDTGWSPS
ncbi:MULTISPECIES: TIGR03086 family metal-binding protein [unclassified Streptomyces]|uniref:TIGR03086 family metal-binding protein n=1 Tax=unclassified Streptomyces TaxID=2593676 RepID=UPI002E2D9E68|nr:MULTISPECIES: TIGR03086 family metal-binding protein [unclassified Streptomyces]WUB90204.1 TIGR03086 family metal-binding protein [Streptomyces sp. NBC_00566]